MEDDTWSATIMGRGDERSPREADEILWEARTKWRRYTLHQTEYAISSANLLFSYISIAGRLLMPTRPATPLGLLIISFYGPPPLLVSGLHVFRSPSLSCPLVCPSAHEFHRYSTFRRAHQRNSLWNSSPFITRARKRTRAPPENENNRKRNKLSNFADQSSLPMLVNFSSPFSFSTFKDCEILALEDRLRAGITHSRLVYFSWQMFRWNYMSRWLERGNSRYEIYPGFPSIREKYCFIYISS